MSWTPYHGLTPAEHERLAWLNEELHEAGQAIGKIMRHGFDSKDPTNPDHEGNRQDLEYELLDVVKAIMLMFQSGDMSDEVYFYEQIHDIVVNREREQLINKYMHEQPK